MMRIVASLALLIAAVVASRTLHQSGQSVAIADAIAIADFSAIAESPFYTDGPLVSVSNSLAGFGAIDTSQISAGSVARTSILRYTSNQPNNFPTTTVQGGAVTSFFGRSNDDDGVATIGGSLITSAATPTSGAIAINSGVRGAAAGPGVVQATAVQGGSVNTPTGSASFSGLASAQDSGPNPQVSIFTSGSAVVTPTSSRSSSTACASSGDVNACN